MNNDIKEILKDDDELIVVYNDNSTRTFDTLTIDVLDYITNLQQENKNRISESLSYDLAKSRIKELQQRIVKAIDYINTDLISEWDIENGGCVSGSDLPVDAITPILDTLLGSDENV